MAGIAGVLKSGQKELVEKMLGIISHRGEYGKEIIETNEVTVGMIWSLHENDHVRNLFDQNIFRIGPGYGHHVMVTADDGNVRIERGRVGVVPLYLGTIDNETVFASEVKAILPVTDNIVELLPGKAISNNKIVTYHELKRGEPLTDGPLEIAEQLKELLQKVVARRINSGTAGAWLSGGLDSSAIAALAKPNVNKLYTFAGGVKEAPDLRFAREAASFIGSEHHEVVIDREMMLKILPDVIYHLESFDALLVRSSIINLCVAYAASNYVTDVFSGEGGDELFAGYSYLKDIPPADLDSELIDITKRLHNTALQRVDRSASAFGLSAHVVLLDPEVVEFALRIPSGYKITGGVEKWIFRKAMSGLLPDSILSRPKAKFWEGAGVESLISDYANRKISGRDFENERKLRNGWMLNSREELFYYRIFREHFGDLENLEWMGRTKGSPVMKEK
ncbi:MAG TPA: asparagine synthase-related protein [Bacteroidales bacterium]|nr:asparagine synthase-related protein [Bacteroidales bacterium]HPT02301.1 asparagine synthase-related protein [Bacteroidales bacterium]